MLLKGKVACVGNMNNMGLPSCLYLKDMGYDVTLFLLNEYDHFLPENETEKDIDLRIVKLGWTEDDFSRIKPSLIRSLFEKFDFIIGTDYAPAYINKAGLRLSVFFPAGTDISLWPFKRPKRFLPRVWEYNYWFCSLSQFWGIKRSGAIAIDPNPDDFEQKVKVLKKGKKVIPALPFHYLPFLSEKIDLGNSVYKEYLENIIKFDFVVFQQSRQEWKTVKSSSEHYKGNEHLIYGFWEFIKHNKVPNACLVLLEYGTDVNASKELIRELNIEDYVIWLPKMPRKFLYAFIQLATVCVGVIGRSTVTNCSIFEILSKAKPIILTRDDKDLISKGMNDLYPILQASNKSEVCEVLNFSFLNSDRLINIGTESRAWVENKNSQRLFFLVQELQNYSSKQFVTIEFFFPTIKLFFSKVIEKLEIVFGIKISKI